MMHGEDKLIKAMFTISFDFFVMFGKRLTHSVIPLMFHACGISLG